MAVSSTTGASTLNPVQVVRDFLDGAIKGADGKSSIARTLGDLVGSAIPGYGQGRAFADLWDGVKTGDHARRSSACKRSRERRSTCATTS